MAVLTGKERANLPDSAFAHIEPGHEAEKADGKTPDKYRHFPVHDAAHTRNALARIAQGAKFAAQAKAKVLAAAKAQGVEHDAGRSLEALYPEMRFIADAPLLEFRSADGNDVPHITGYASMFHKLSRRLGGFVERVNPTAFNEARDAGFPDVVCRYNHRDDMVLGTTGGGTLSLDVDERGLRYDVDPPRSRADVLELVQRRDVRYSSFAFRCAEPGWDEWGLSDFGLPLRSLHRVDLVDVAPVLDPAYFDTSAAARSMSGAVESLARWVDAAPDEVRSFLSAGQASKFFKRSDRPSPPKPAPEAAVLDDAAGALRDGEHDPDAPTEAELTAADAENEETEVPEVPEVPEAPEAPEAEETEVPEVPETDERSAPTEDEAEERTAPTEDELRAAVKTYDQLCRKWTAGEPCVRPDGHKGDCAPVCWSRSGGLPCAKPMDHDGDHEAMHIVNSRSAEEEQPAETRSDEPEAPEAGMSVLQSQMELDEMRAAMVAQELELA